MGDLLNSSLFIFVDFLVSRFYGRNKAALIAFLCAVALTYSVFTGIRGKVWKTEISFWTDVLEKNPNIVSPYNNISRAYYKIGKFDCEVRGPGIRYLCHFSPG